MAKKRSGKRVEAKGSSKKKPVEESSHKSLFSKFCEKYVKKSKSEFRKKEEQELKHIEKEISALEAEIGMEKQKSRVPAWFYMASIFAAFLFAVYISVFTTLHFETIEYMNITIVFLFIAMVSFFLVSGIYFISEKMKSHAIAPLLFFIGVASIMIYAFKAVDTSDLVRFSIIYAIIVAAISAYVLAIRRK